MTREGDVNTLLLCTCTLHHIPPSKRPAAHAAHATATIVHVHELVAVAALFTLNLSVVGCGRLVSGTAGEQQQSPHMHPPGPVAGGRRGSASTDRAASIEEDAGPDAILRKMMATEEATQALVEKKLK